MYVAPEVKILYTLTNVAVTSQTGETTGSDVLPDDVW